MKNKKSLITIIVMAIVVIVGMTLAAYFTDAILPGLFHADPYNTSITELFVSPDDWRPGQTTQKKVYATNESNTDVVVRISFDESWTSKNGNELSKYYNGEPVAMINFSNNSDWIKIGDYYYYDGVLSKNDYTSDFIDSITFNKNIEIDDTCTTSVDGNTITCVSSGNGYDSGKYRLTLNVEMVQADFYKDAWNIDYNLGSRTYKNYFAPYLVSKANSDPDVSYLAANKRELYAFEQAATPQVSQNTDYRYIGDSPNNYVYYNCTDDTDDTTCEKWRIIGVFNVENENGDIYQQVKIINPNVYQNITWSSSQKTWINSDAQQSLNNGEFWNSLSTNAQEMVSNAKYYIAKLSNSLSNSSASTWYYNERTLQSYADSQAYSIDKFALMYPSDYLYTFGKGVNNGCYNNSYNCTSESNTNNEYNAKASWIFNTNLISSNQLVNSALWFMNPEYEYDNYLAVLNGNGSIRRYYLGYSSSGLRPVAYLKPGVIRVSGDGSETNPYKIQLLKYNITIDNNLFIVPNQGVVGDKYYLQHSDIYEIDSFKMNDVLVTGDNFIMPEEDVSITDVVYHQI